ncbi:MAG: alpha/beta fold hydrolase [Bacillota bacterium]
MNGKADLVFLHGWAMGPEVWVCQEKYFSRNRVIKVNYHKGVYDALVGNDISPYAAAALEVINRETDGPVILFGWSLGAMVALELAALMQRKIAGLVLAGGTARFTRTAGYDGGLPGVLVERMKKRLTQNPGRTLEGFYCQMFAPGEQEEGIYKQLQLEMLSRGPAWSGEELAAGLDFLMNRDLRRYLNNIETPCLIIHGERDEICPSAAGRYLHENLKGSRFQLMPGCGHMPFFSRPVIFNERLRRWMDTLD